MVLQHLEYALEYYGEKTAVPMFRKHVAWYSAGMKDATHFRMKINQLSKLIILNPLKFYVVNELIYW